MDEATVRERVRQLLSSGQLPTTVPEWWWIGGRPIGRECEVCRTGVTARDVPVELEGALVVHAGCYLVWKEEAQMHERTGAARTAGQ